MKTKQIIMGLLSLLLFSVGCSKSFLDKTPQGELTGEQIDSKDGVEALLIGAYGILNGNRDGTWGNYASAPSQWLFGEVTADNAHKGSEESDQPSMSVVELLQVNPANTNVHVMWRVYYEGVQRCNMVLKGVKRDQEGGKTLSAARALEIEAEARMLRGHYYFYLWRVFKNIPWVDETMTEEQRRVQPNDKDVFPLFQKDIQFAVDNLPEGKVNGEKGRMDKRIAKAYLGKLYLYKKQFSLALPLFEELLQGQNLIAMPFQDNFNVEKEDGPEALFVAKHAINSNGSGDNANVGDMLSGLYGTAPVSCCGFYQPTIDLVNAYRVDENGLPFLDEGYRDSPYVSDFGLTEAEKKVYTLNDSLRFDPRLDYTVGRRGVPYLDYGVMPGDAWIRASSYAGPFVGIKTMVYKQQFASYTVPGMNHVTALDVNIIRLADVVLMAAECAIEEGDLAKALRYVNTIRARAATLPAKVVNGKPTADYVVGTYLSFPNADYARKAVRMERRMELAMEGHRFYDLVRWDIAADVIRSFTTFESKYLTAYKDKQYRPINAIFPIPQEEIDRSDKVLKQNPGY